MAELKRIVDTRGPVMASAFEGLPTSMFSAKTRAYLRFKDIPYVEKVPSMYTYGRLPASSARPKGRR